MYLCVGVIFEMEGLLGYNTIEEKEFQMLKWLKRIFESIRFRCSPEYQALKEKLSDLDAFNAWGAGIERQSEFEILSVIGARTEENAQRLADYYVDECFEMFDGKREMITETPEFSLEECRKIVLNDTVFEAFTSSYLRIFRDVSGGEAMIEARNRFLNLLKNTPSIHTLEK